MRVRIPQRLPLLGGIGLLACWLLSGCNTGTAETQRLREALYAGDQAAVSSALAAGADANGLDDDGNPFLLYALYSEDGAAVRALLESGADVAAQVRPTTVKALIDMGAASPGPEALTSLVYGVAGAREDQGAAQSQADFERLAAELQGFDRRRDRPARPVGGPRR